MTPERWQKIEQVYHAALEREESQRAAYLREVCAGDDALRREVESLLAQEKRGDALLESPALEVAARALAEDQSQSSLVGQKLGSYKILSLLGAGGMGEVYQAQDTKLGRDVAIKVLPAAFVHDVERLARFQREARMLAALNHPNIATIHGLEQSDGVHYLVMELVPGQTLAERLGGGALKILKIKEALKLGVQIAEALEAAHERGVIHRDLKPANVKVTPEGRVKVLDFGLAKAFAGDSGQDLSSAATLTAMGTEEGMILGTPAYMSPEQARGKAVDKRTDIWAFGCVLYEMLAGKVAFRGATVSDTIVAVLEREPDWQALPAATPTKIRDLLRRCLQKESQHRLRDIGDARIEIEEASAAPAMPEPAATRKGVRALGRQVLILSVGALLLVAIVTGLTMWNLKSSPAPTPQPVSRTVITLPPGQQLAGLDLGPAVALSPDGSRLAYVARQGGTQQLYLRAMDSQEAKLIPGTEGAVNPFFSPDGQWLGFFASGKLKKVSVNGGAALTLGDGVTFGGASWGSQGMIAISPTSIPGLQQVPDTGGTPQTLTLLEKGDASHRWPEFLPGGKTVLFAAGPAANNWTDAQVAVQSVGTGDRRNLVQGGTHPRYALSGHLVYAQGGRLMVVPFDPQRLRTTGAAIPLVEGVLQSTITGAAQYSLSSTGSLVYVPGTFQSDKSKLVWVSRNGAQQPVVAPAHAYRQPRLSPDGRRVAVTINEQGDQVWLYDLSRETLTRYTFEGNRNTDPAWTPDGKRIAFESNKEGPQNLFWQLADGSGGLERLTTSDYTQFPLSWSPDGQLLAFIEFNPTTGRDIWMLRLGDRKAQPFLRTPFDETSPQFSPDGRWLAYASNESGPYEIYAQPYPGPGGKWQISTEGGTEPVWNRNGRELFYRSGDKMMAVDIATQPSFAAGKPRMLFEGQYQQTPVTFPNYDVSRDGQRFLMLKPSEQAASAPTQINVVLNWFEELKRRVPAKQ
jgi:eukaryotic-like serine/threonine-protein kinase